VQHKSSSPKKTWRGTWLLFFSFSILLSVESALAMTVVERPFSDLIHRAEIIAVGTVTEVRAQWDAAKQVPLTAVTFSDVTILKGHVHPTPLTLYFLGGPTLQGTHLSIPGMPRFVAGEKTVVFSAGNQRDFCPLVGLWQGRLRVVFDPQRRVETVQDNFHVPIVGLKGGRFLKKRLSPSATQEALSLPALIQLIQHELQRSNGQP
jgi:hypothetical protein